MLKVRAGNLLVLGFSFGNIDRFIAAPGDTHIKASSEETNLPLDVIVFSGAPMRALGTDRTSGKTIFMIGLSIDELNLLRATPGKSIIRLKGASYNIPCDILIFSGETEIKMGEMFHDLIGPETNAKFDPRTTH